MKYALLLLPFIFVLACQKTMVTSSTSARKNTSVIYGEDNRLEVSEVSEPKWIELAKSTMALISKQYLVYDNVFDKYNVSEQPYPTVFCAGEKFTKQPQTAFCSGTLIGPDLVLTAGHCIREYLDCQDTKFVFDYSKGHEPLDSFPGKNVFSCKQILYSTQKNSAADFALIRLDREVEGRASIQISSSPLDFKDQLLMIGHPAGLPTKFTPNGKIRSLIDETYFKAVLDSFSGNSGSGVFDQNTLKLVGVLSRGESDFEKQGDCYVAKICDENGCRGEDVTRGTEVRKFIPPQP